MVDASEILPTWDLQAQPLAPAQGILKHQQYGLLYCQRCLLDYQLHSLKLAAKTPGNRQGPKNKSIFQRLIFRGYVSFKEGITSATNFGLFPPKDPSIAKVEVEVSPTKRRPETTIGTAEIAGFLVTPPFSAEWQKWVSDVFFFSNGIGL